MPSLVKPTIKVIQLLVTVIDGKSKIASIVLENKKKQQNNKELM